MKRKLLVITLLGIVSLFSAQGQNNKNIPQKVSSILKADKVRHVEPLSKRGSLKRAVLNGSKEMKDGRSSKFNVVPDKGSQGDDILAKNPHSLKNAVQSQGLNNEFQSGVSTSMPTDPSGAVGPNHYVAVINTAFQIYDKQGNDLTVSLSPDNIFSTDSCCDLTVSYDNLADRWVMTILFSGEGAEIAVSDGPDPVNSGWYVYSYSKIVDYQKLSVWSDGYYITENTPSSTKLHVLERDKMLLGDVDAKMMSFALPGLVTYGFHSPQALNITDNNYPDVGSAPIIFMADDSWNGVTQDHLKVWSTEMDWDNPEDSYVTAPQEIPVTAFQNVFDGGSFANLEQPGANTGHLDALQGMIMNQAQWRWFPTHRSAVFNFVVDTDGGLGELAGIRWYELRQNGNGMPWYIYQEGTYTAPDGKHAWNASIAMDGYGNIGMGYTAMSGPTTPSTVYVGSYYTGRTSSDPLNVMTISETVIKAGTENIPKSSNGNPAGSRFGDYSKIDVDPVNDKDFWFNNELMFLFERRNWVGVFQIAPNTSTDVGVVKLDSPVDMSSGNPNQAISVTLYNYGSASASNFDISYRIDNGSLVTETFSGTIAPGTYEAFTFATTFNMSSSNERYEIYAETSLSGDQNEKNDFTNTFISVPFVNDVGIIKILEPFSTSNLGNESISVRIKNYGSSTQSNFDVAYTLDGNSPVVETYNNSISPGEIKNFIFTQTGDFSSIGDHDLSATTSLGTDQETQNDEVSIIISNLTCSDSVNSDSQSVGPDEGTITSSIITITDNFIIKDVNVNLNLDHTWDGDLEIKLVAPNSGGEVILYDPGNESGENFVNTIFDDDASTEIFNGTPPYTGPYKAVGSLADFNGLQSAGDWTLVITDTADGDSGTLNNWTLELCENVTLSLDKNKLDFELTIIDQGESQFLVTLPSQSIYEQFDLEVYNVLGQKIYWQTVDHEGLGLNHNIDMSYVETGIYFVRLTNGHAGNTKRIIVSN